jgi:IS30 family transposase
MASSSSVLPVSCKRKSLSLAQRVDVLKRLEAKENQTAIAKSFGVHPTQISRILKQKDAILEDWQNKINPDRKRKRNGKAEDVEAALLH